MNSALLKTEALCWLRFTKKMDFACTEGGYWNADVIGTNDEFSIEVEVKVSRADMLAEFRNKGAKHHYYDAGERFTPTYFYFLVPQELVEDALEVIPKKMPKAGILTYAYPRERDGKKLKTVRKAQKLRDRKPTEKFKRGVLLRQGSELCGLHLAMQKLKGVEIGSIEVLRQDITNALIAAMGPGEWEEDA